MNAQSSSTAELWYPSTDPLLVNFNIADLLKSKTCFEMMNLGQSIIQFCLKNGEPPCQLAPSTIFLILSPWLSAPEELILKDLHLVRFLGCLDSKQAKALKYVENGLQPDTDMKAVTTVAYQEVIERQIPAAIMIRQGILFYSNEDITKLTFRKWINNFEKGAYKNWKPEFESEITSTNLKENFYSQMDVLYFATKEKMWSKLSNDKAC